MSYGEKNIFKRGGDNFLRKYTLTLMKYLIKADIWSKVLTKKLVLVYKDG